MLPYLLKKWGESLHSHIHIDNFVAERLIKSSYAKHLQTKGEEKKKYRIFYVTKRIHPKYEISKPVHQQAGRPDADPPISVSCVRGSKAPLN